MHQLANSVIIFDEVQALPISCIHMLNSAIQFLVHSCGASVVLCTATQPPLDKIDVKHRALMLQADQRIIADEQALFEKLKRVEVFDRRSDDGYSDDDVAELAAQEVQQQGSVLVIVNTRKSARSLYDNLAGRNLAKTYHLSTNMCPAHRLDILNEIKEKLAEQQPVVCVSTQLIEAGVDIDFGSVIRYLAGFDSIVQAAGRCNRNGIRPSGNVWIVNPRDENLSRLKDIRIGADKAERVLDDFRDDPDVYQNSLISPTALADYYKYYYFARKEDMRYPVGPESPVGRDDDLFTLLSVNTRSLLEYKRLTGSSPDITFKQSFQTAAKAFRVIDSSTKGVVVQYHLEGEQLISDLCGTEMLEKQYALLKKMQRFSVNLFPHEFEKLIKIGAAREVQAGTGIYYLDKQYYSEQFGWTDEVVNDMETLIA
jgi:CRISPR-associated endonuclease/helicase Cas3